jgi:hypothetical protein
MFQDEGASTDVTGMRVSSNARMTAGKGSRTSPEKENPKDVSGGAGRRMRRQTEDGVDDMVCFFQSSGKVIREWNV